jgi:16S rRNA (uracil1498-N3)-methyltransferase
MRDPTHFLFFARQITGNTAHVSLDEYHHAVKALRLDPADLFNATDGCGSLFTCKNLVKSGNDAVAEIVSIAKKKREAAGTILYVGLPEKSAFEIILEHASALNIREIVPIVCDFCQEKWWDNTWEKLASRLNAVLVSGLKQSLSTWLPKLAKPFPFAGCLQKAPKPILYADMAGIKIAASLIQSTEPVSCFVGPPGGFSEQELGLLKDAGANGIALSPHRMRTELACIALASAVLQRDQPTT